MKALMKALSVRQPWAWAIFYAGKDIENRGWPTRHRGGLIIHAAKTYDSSGHDLLVQRFGLTIPTMDKLKFGGLIGTVNLIDCVTESVSPWFFGPYGFVMAERTPITFVPCRGALGFFDVSGVDAKCLSPLS